MPSIRTEWHRFVHLSVGYVVIMNPHHPSKKGLREGHSRCIQNYFGAAFILLSCWHSYILPFFSFASFYCSLTYICMLWLKKKRKKYVHGFTCVEVWALQYTYLKKKTNHTWFIFLVLVWFVNMKSYGVKNNSLIGSFSRLHPASLALHGPMWKNQILVTASGSYSAFLAGVKKSSQRNNYEH